MQDLRSRAFLKIEKFSFWLPLVEPASDRGGDTPELSEGQEDPAEDNPEEEDVVEVGERPPSTWNLNTNLDNDFIFKFRFNKI